MIMTNLNLFKRVTTAYDLERMRRSRLVGAGCGGARQYYEDMARAGVGQFVITDPDLAEESNIATQQVYLEEIGRAKVDCLADRILQINPGAHVVVYQKSLDEIDDAEFAELALTPMYRLLPHEGGLAVDDESAEPPEITLVCGFTDNFYAQARVNRLALQFGLPSTTVVTMCGQQDDACSDSDEREPDGCDGKRTSPDGRTERVEVFQAGKRRVGVFQGC